MVNSAGTPTRLPTVRATLAAFCSCITFIAWQALPIQADDRADQQETTARKVTPASFDALPTPEVDLPDLPAAFSKAVPESIEDLREIESHVQSLVARLTESTVALTVGNAQGSGVIVSEEGLVLTAAHVSGPPGRDVRIVLSDGTRARGRSLGRNRTLDASLIRIDSPKKKWTHAPLADVNEIQVGDWSVVLGHPGGHQRGRPPVFRLGRVITFDSGVVQTDNELVGGDSGGPLFDMHGRVIGINSRIGPDTSLNLHTPVSVYTADWERLVASEDFALHSGALLGVSGESTEEGLKLTKIWPHEPAERAGLLQGDILVEFDSQRVETFDRLRELIGEHRPGRRVTLSLLRDGQIIEKRVRLGARR